MGKHVSPLESHLAQQEEENIKFLVQTGSSLEEACRRVGVSLKAYEKRNQPARKGTAA